MKFEVSERLASKISNEEILTALEYQFRKISEGVNRSGQVLEVKSIEASFGSINRNDVTSVSLKQTSNGLLMIADVVYKPSIAFWIILIITLFTWVFWLIPLAFYLLQKEQVKTAISACFQRIKNEFDQTAGDRTPASGNAMDDIERLGSMVEKGLLTSDEFEAKKKQLLGI